MNLEYQLFIDKFKRVEQAVKLLDGYNNTGSPVKFLEDYLDGSPLQTKIRMCRNVRNYIQHEPDYENFIRISPGMLECLDDVLKAIEPSFNRQLTKDTLFTKSADIHTAVLAINKYGHIVVVDSWGVFISILDSRDIVKYLQMHGYAGNVMDVVNAVGVNRSCEFISNSEKATGNTISLITTTGSYYEAIQGELL